MPAAVTEDREEEEEPTAEDGDDAVTEAETDDGAEPAPMTAELEEADAEDAAEAAEEEDAHAESLTMRATSRMSVR